MKKLISCFLCLVILSFMFSGCGKENAETKELKEYKESMIEFCDSLLEIDSQIKAIDPEDQTSINQLFDEFDKLEQEYKKLAEMSIPKDFAVNESLADEAYDYMVQANDYLHQSYAETSYNPYTLEASMECYKRASKRVTYIISILHGELPKDDNVTYN